MRDIPSVNSNSLNNDFCKASCQNEENVCSRCYSNKYLKMRPSLADCLDLNDEILSLETILKRDLPVFNNLYVRFNAFGEIINKNHYLNLMKICGNNPKTTFALWTKMALLVKEFAMKPNNLILVYSATKINSLHQGVPEWFDKTFIVYTRKFANENKIDINCKRACMDCLKCYNKDNRPW